MKHPDAVDEQRQVTVSTDMDVSINMWRRRPSVVQLRPTYPGAGIGDAQFLTDGRLTLSMALPVQAGGLTGGVLREAWIFDPATGRLQPFDTTGAGPRAARLALATDGRRVAYLRAEQSNAQTGGGGPRLREVWVAVAGHS